MKKAKFLHVCLLPARQAGEAFDLNPVIILAQAALESGWGRSTLAREHNNFFGITAYGPTNAYWLGDSVQFKEDELFFRAYRNARLGFMDYGRLLCQCYQEAARLSYEPAAFALTIAYSRYISEANGDDREAYRRALCSLASEIGKLIKNEQK
jgi:flagellar protein FlgJ